MNIIRFQLIAALMAVAAAYSVPASAEAVPKWTVACESAAKDQFGEKRRQYCSLLVFNSKGAKLVMDDGRTYVGNSRTVVEVDARGLHPMKPLRGSQCTSGPKRMAVDGKRVDGMPAGDQLRAMTAGRVFIWEEQANWPNCQNVAPHGTSLEGFREALTELQARFNAIR